MLLRLAVLTTIVATQVVAQTEPPTGLAALSLSAGGGSGALKLMCTGCAAGYHAPANSARLWMGRLAFANTAHTIVGVEYDNWQRSQTILVTDPVTLDIVPAEQTTTASWIDVTLQWYPVAHGTFAGLYAKGALGLTTLKLEPGTSTLKNTGGGGGIGWDISVTKLLAITPSYDVLSARRSKLRTISPVTHSAFQLGAFMTSYSLAIKFKGLP
jgi:hypothetical protein